MIKIKGDVPSYNRLVTSLHSFDRAFLNEAGDIGFPLGIITEIHGLEGSGKSTTAYSLAGMIANHLKSDISLLDFEGYDPDFLIKILTTTGFDGTVNHVTGEDDETSMDNLLLSLNNKKENNGVGILDSASAISPISEAEGDLGEANMGRRAKLLTTFLRKALKVLRDNREKGNDKTIFITNHVLPVIGGRGYYTPGGKAIHFYPAVRMRVRKKEIFPDGSYAIEGTIYKFRFGYDNKQKFYYIVLAGIGIHIGMSALYDCTLIKKTGIDRKARNMIYAGGEKLQSMATYAKQAKRGENEVFDIFIQRLKELNNGSENIESDGEE